MVWHLQIGSKLWFLDSPEVLSKIWENLVKKFKPPERPLLEVRRFFLWCQGMSLGILKRFRKKIVHFFLDLNFGWNIQRLLLKSFKGRLRDICLREAFIKKIKKRWHLGFDQPPLPPYFEKRWQTIFYFFSSARPYLIFGSLLQKKILFAPWKV